MEALPSEISANILSRLPVKSLIRFSSVSKFWNSFIKTPNFIKLHLTQTLISNSDRHLILSDPALRSAELDLHPTRLSFSELHHPLEPHKINIIGSCNGVVCFTNLSKNDLVLYNPLTQSHRKVKVPSDGIFKIANEWIGFGYDSKNDDYKALKMVQKQKDDTLFGIEPKVYSLNNNSWKPVQGITYYLYYEYSNGVLVNEALHYLGAKNFDFVSFQSHGEFIASFNLQTQSFSFMDCPGFDTYNLRIERLLAELGGCLCTMVSYNHISGFESRPSLMDHADLWVMKEYGKKESWVRLFRVCRPEDIRANLEIKPVAYSEHEQRVLLEVDCMSMYWYDLNSREFEECVVHGLPNGTSGVVKFDGSLVLFEDKLRVEKETLPKKNNQKKKKKKNNNNNNKNKDKKEKNDLDNFLSVGFNLKL